MAEPRQPYISVIIPAHNEAGTIGRCLGPVIAGSRPEQVEIIVVCNGCTDSTAQVAADASSRVRVVEIDEASKIEALRRGDRIAHGANRAYMDADTLVSSGAINRVVEALEKPGVMAAAPSVRFDSHNCGWAARQLHSVWQRAPYWEGTVLGAGFYALSVEGRSRFDEFPDLVGDDAFVAALFTEAERSTADGESFTPLLPTRVRDFVRVHTRHLRGNLELESWAAEHLVALPGRPHRSSRWLVSLARQPSHWPGIVLYLGSKVVAEASARRATRRSKPAWERDEAARGSVAS